MSERGAEFLVSWVESHLESQERPAGWDGQEASAKAEQCVAAAEARGIPKAELEAEVGPIAGYMRVMMTTPTDIGIVQLAPDDENAAPAP